jgi:DNA-binding IclR family transcriptional regulator
MAVMAAASQTLSRGIAALELLSESDRPLSIGELGEQLGLHRSITYRIVRTLEEHGLVVRDAGGLLTLGPRLAALARSVAQDLRIAALPELSDLAAELEMTAFIAVLDGSEVVTLFSVEPRNSRASVAQRPGTRHSLLLGAPGVAIQSILSKRDRERVLSLGSIELPEKVAMTGLDFSASHDEVISGLSSIAVPLKLETQPPAALAVVYVNQAANEVGIARRLQSGADRIKAELGM